MNKTRVATVWLDGCSGCHMSFLDIDERVIDLAQKIDLVYSPLVDIKEFPDSVDVTLVEGAVSSEDDFKKIQKIRAHTKILVSLGDCAVNANVPSMRNQFTPDRVLERAYVENASLQKQIPRDGLPRLLDKVVPVHQVVPVDLIVQGCPPSADTIFYMLCELLEGRIPDLSERTRFG